MLTVVQLFGQLLAAVILILAPTLLFLACWHGMYALRNERLIAKLYDNADRPVRRPRFDFSVLWSLNETETGSPSANACAYCGRRCSGTICSRCDERY